LLNNPQMKNWSLALAPLLTGVLLVLCFPPFKLFFPSFIALIPFFYFLERESSTARTILGAFLCGFIFWGGLLYWITLFTRAGYLVLILIMTMNQVIFALLVRKLKDRLGIPLVISAPFVWTAIEYIHAYSDLALTWGQIAYTLTDYPVWLQMASYTGSYGITFWLVAINALLYETGVRMSKGKMLRPLPALLTAFFILPPGLGIFRYLTYEKTTNWQSDQLKVCYVQPSIPQDIKWSPGMRDSTFELLASLSTAQARNGPELVLWPEAAAPANLRLDLPCQRFVGDLARRLNAYLLTGAPEYRLRKDGKDYDSFNSAFLFDPQGKLIGSYDKIHMVPVSERMPFEDIFTSLQEIDVGGSHFMPGTSYAVFRMEKEKFGVLICFESSFPELSREFTSRGANFLVNITNDAWFERTSAAYQHSAFLVLRAIEEGREIIRSANTGISAFYDRLGRRRLATVLFEQSSATDTIRTYRDFTFYCCHGDWPAHLCCAVSSILTLLLFIPRKILKLT